MNHFQKWLLFAPLGLSCTGAGLCLFGDALLAKAAGEPWFWPGTLSLCVFNAGIVLIAESVKQRMLHEKIQKGDKS